MKKSAYSETIYPNEWEEHILIRRCHQTINKIMYKKVEGGYQVLCTNCGAKEIMPFKKLKMVRNAGVCWKCGRERETTTKTFGTISKFISSPKNSGDVFYVTIMYDWEKILDWNVDHVIHYDNNGTYVRKLTKFMYAQVYCPERDYWRKTKAYYGDYYFGNAEILDETYTLKKHYIEAEALLGAFKSNQKEFICKGVYNIEQLRYINFFDINCPEDIENNNSYIKKNPSTSLIHQDFKLNKYYLDYLKREKIPLADFMDYARACRYQNIKIGKPKKENFWKEHDDMTMQREILKKAKFEDGVEKRRIELKELEFEKDGIAIKVFDNVAQIVSTGKRLHNCIGTYCEKYAEQKTNIFYGTVEGELAFALEVADKKVIQARSDHNGTVPSNVKKVIRDWCNQSGFAWNQS